MKNILKQINPHAMRMLFMAGNVADIRDAIRWERANKKQDAKGILLNESEIDDTQMFQEDL